jgi:hypothetical protein
VKTLVVNPQDPSVLYAGGVNFDPEDGHVVGGGIFRSTDGGGTWGAVGLADYAINALACSPATPNTIYGGSEGQGVFMSTDGGTTWSQANTGLSNLFIRILAIDSNSILTYAGTRGDGLFKIQGVAPLPTLIFPQFVNGLANGANSSRIVIRNNAAQLAIGHLRFLSATGEGNAVPIGGLVKDTEFFSLSPFGVLDIRTDGTGDLRTGVVAVQLSSGNAASLEGTLIFSLLGSFVSIDSSMLRAMHQAFVSFDSDPITGERTGIAAHNPSPNAIATLRMLLADDRGEQVALREDVQIGPGGQLLGFADEQSFFPEFFQDNPRFVGTLNISVTSGPKIAVLSLIQKNVDGALIAVSTSGKILTSQQ